MQNFLDTNAYNVRGILRYERVFGRSFISPGGLKTCEQFCQMLGLKRGDRVLDVGCGIGGSAFHIAETYGAKVHAVDLSSNMISEGLKRRKEHPTAEDGVSFELCDVTLKNFGPDSFDVIYSRDAILHIPGKEALFQKFFSWLKPDGKLLISDYCLKQLDHYTQEFVEYIQQRAYSLITIQNYKDILEKVGFANVRAEDRSEQFRGITEEELDAFVNDRGSFLKDFSQEDYDYIVRGWESKKKRSAAGEQAWGLFVATKPSS